MGVYWIKDDISVPRPVYRPPSDKTYVPYLEGERRRKIELTAMESIYGSEQFFPVPPIRNQPNA